MISFEIYRITDHCSFENFYEFISKFQVYAEVHYYSKNKRRTGFKFFFVIKRWDFAVRNYAFKLYGFTRKKKQHVKNTCIY